MKRLCYALALLVAVCSTSQADILIGTDLADAQSGTAVDLELGTTTTLEIWLAGDADQNIRAISFNWNSDAAGIVNSSSLVIDDVNGRWPLNNLGQGDPTAESGTGLLLDDVQLATLGSFAGTGVTFTNGDPVRLGTVDISADNLGTAITNFSDGSNGVLDANGVVDGFAVGGRTFNVISAVPEPSAVALLGMFAGIATLRRRRS